MRTLSKEETASQKERIKQEILGGAVFVHPTDTIYGLGCDATNSDAVAKVREMKDRFEMPFSVIAPSKEWIIENCEITKKAEEWIEKLPGPYTLIMKLKNKGAVSEKTNMGMDTLGVRMPKHWISGFVRMLGVPCITTSANKVGGNFMTSIESLDPSIKSKVDFIIYEGEIQGSPSQLVHLDKDEVVIKKR